MSQLQSGVRQRAHTKSEAGPRAVSAEQLDPVLQLLSLALHCHARHCTWHAYPLVRLQRQQKLHLMSRVCTIRSDPWLPRQHAGRASGLELVLTVP